MSSTATWDDCIGPSKWLREPLHHVLSYPQPLPLQQAVIPTITRALMSGVPNDVSLTAPTGSGKTLCYLLPLVRLLTEAKKGVDDNALRCLILVPSQTLGSQVHRELQRLTRPTSIKTACICAEAVGATVNTSTELDAAEARELVRQVVFPRFDSSEELTTDWGREAGESDKDTDTAENDEVGVDEGQWSISGYPQQRMKNTTVRYFSNVDVIISTPQRLLHHLDHTPGLRLATLRLLVVDEADQVLAGNFAAQVQKVNARYEFEVQQQQRHDRRRQERICTRLTSAMSFNSASLSDSPIPTAAALSTPLHQLSCFGGAATTSVPARTGPILHKMICSATLSSRIARISHMKLRNCSYFILDSNGEERKEEGMVSSTQGATGAVTASGAGTVVRTQFALPPTLQEHIIFVEDTYRPAVLLKLVHALRLRIAATAAQKRADAVTALHLEAEVTAEGGDRSAPRQAGISHKMTPQYSSAISPASSYPQAEERAGMRILIFCATAEEARVMSHFLAAAGVVSVIEFTTLSSEAERRRALLERAADVNGGDSGADVSCVVASDALMRGIDIPNVGHVIMYHPPETVSQYVHRAGRTARAMRPGHVHLLLGKTGPSGTQEDGEMALYKRLSQSLSRTLPVSYERGFFRFAEAPAPVGGVSAPRPLPTKETHTTVATTAPLEVDSAEWWVAQAGQFLLKSQHQLQRRWASVLESAAAQAKTNAPVAIKGNSTAVTTMTSTIVAEAGKIRSAPQRKRHRSIA